jgi:hypothetical protein
VEDFPKAKFVHTVRDPISSCDALFHFHLDALVENHLLLPHSALNFLVEKDRPMSGMEARTCAIRFEDLHSSPAETMHALADWLGLNYGPTLIQSTFNGIPYVMRRDGVAWSGRRVEQLQRLSRHLSRKDRALLFALFYENFVEWDYPRPKMFRYLTVRCMVFVSLILAPMKTEITAARLIFQGRIMPALRRGDLTRAAKALMSIAVCRLRIIFLLAPAFFRRCVRRPVLLQTGHKQQPLEPCDASAHELHVTN